MSERLRLKIFGFALVLCVIGAGSLLWYTARPPDSSLQRFGPVGSFALRSQAGGAFGSADLAGAVWIADVIYTRCTGPCPLMTERMAALDRDLPAGVRLVTVTADPAHDTPAVLRRYIAARHLATARWTFLTGAPAAVRTLLRDRFRLPAGDPTADHGTIVVPHTEKLVLVDAAGTIRGYYESGDPAELGRLRREALRVLSEPPAPPTPPTGG